MVTFNSFGTTALENVVRPFALKNLLPGPTQLPRATPPGFTDCALGGSGGMSISFTTSSFGGFVEEEEEKFKESGRDSELKRVENEDDPSQFVEFCRAKKVTLSPKNEGSKPPRTSSYDGGAGTAAAKKARQREYEFQYPDEPTCVSPDPPRGGNC